MKTIENLPFYLQNSDYLDILDNEDVIIATINTHQNEKEVGEYIIEACNNYPKAIEFLTACRNYMNFIPNKIQGIEHYTLLSEVHKFLQSIENQ